MLQALLPAGQAVDAHGVRCGQRQFSAARQIDGMGILSPRLRFFPCPGVFLEIEDFLGKERQLVLRIHESFEYGLASGSESLEGIIGKHVVPLHKVRCAAGLLHLTQRIHESHALAAQLRHTGKPAVGIQRTHFPYGVVQCTDHLRQLLDIIRRHGADNELALRDHVLDFLRHLAERLHKSGRKVKVSRVQMCSSILAWVLRHCDAFQCRSQTSHGVCQLQVILCGITPGSQPLGRHVNAVQEVRIGLLQQIRTFHILFPRIGDPVCGVQNQLLKFSDSVPLRRIVTNLLCFVHPSLQNTDVVPGLLILPEHPVELPLPQIVVLLVLFDLLLKTPPETFRCLFPGSLCLLILFYNPKELPLDDVHIAVPANQRRPCRLIVPHGLPNFRRSVMAERDHRVLRLFDLPRPGLILLPLQDILELLRALRPKEHPVQRLDPVRCGVCLKLQLPDFLGVQLPISRVKLPNLST